MGLVVVLLLNLEELGVALLIQPCVVTHCHVGCAFFNGGKLVRSGLLSERFPERSNVFTHGFDGGVVNGEFTDQQI